MIFAKHWTFKKIVIIFHRPVKSEGRDDEKLIFLIWTIRIDTTIIVDKLDQANHSQVPMIHDSDISDY